MYTEQPLICFIRVIKKCLLYAGQISQFKITLSVMLVFTEELSCNAATAMFSHFNRITLLE